MKLFSKNFSFLKFVFPHYWGMWLAISILWLLIKILPININLWLGKKLGSLAYYLLKKRRHIVNVNLKICFPQKTLQQRHLMEKKIFESVGMGVVENALAWWAKSDTLKHRSNIEGMEHYYKAVATQRPIILCTGHFTTFEIAGRILTEKFTYQAIYRQQKNPAYNAVMIRARKKHLSAIIDRNDVRAMLTALKAKIPLWIAPDQDYGKKRSVFVPFFGIQAASITSVAKLARLSNAVVLPYYSYRNKNNHYTICFQPSLTNFPSEDLEKDTFRINQVIELGIRPYPEQYLWLHRRFKTRPRGEKNLY